MSALDVHLDADELARTLRSDVIAGLTAGRNGYRRNGSTTPAAANCSSRSPNCPSTTRPARSGRSCSDRAAEIAQHTGAQALVELGSGYSTKTRLLLDALTAHGTLEAFVPMDVSPTALDAAATPDHRGLPGAAGA